MLKTMAQSPDFSTSVSEGHWWETENVEEAGNRAQDLYGMLTDQDKARQAAYTSYSRLYRNRDIESDQWISSQLGDFAASQRTEFSRLPLNMAKTMVDAVFSRITRPGISVEFLPTGGNPSLRQKSKQLTQFVDHMTHKNDIRREEKRCIKDALVYNVGILKTYAHDKAKCVMNERIHPRNILVDPVETENGCRPSHIYQKQFVAKSKLKKMFPQHEAVIDSVGRIDTNKYTDFASREPELAGLVEVVEGWKRESWDKAGDGKHIMFIDGQVLDLSEWVGDFPFSFVHWKDDPEVGFFGTSLVEELVGPHTNLNTCILQANLTVETMPKPYMLIPEDSEINVGSIANVHGIIIKYSGREPKIIMPQSVPADIVNYALQQWQWGLQVSGLQPLGMPEKMGNQIETGKGVANIVDIQSTELAPAFTARSDFRVRIAEQNIIAGNDLDEMLDGGYKVVLRKDRRTVKGIDWSEIAIDPKDDSFVIQAQPISSLSSHFGTRLAEVKELLAAGLIPMSRAFKLLDVPDLDGEMKIQNASLDLIERIMEDILDEGKYVAPEPTMDLTLALKVSQKYINFAQVMEAPDENLNMLDDFLREVDDLIQQQQQETRLQASGFSDGLAGAPPALGIDGMAPAAGQVQGPQ